MIHAGGGSFGHVASKPETVLEEAQRIIYGDREKTYGHPSRNFDNTASFWNEYLAAKYGIERMICADDVALMMVLLKLARELHLHKRDSIVDICGYAACIEKMREYDQDQAKTA